MMSRLIAVLYFCQINTILFFAFGYFLPDWIAINLAMIITAGAFMSDRCKKYRDQLKQPELWVSQDEYDRSYKNGWQ